MELVKLTVQFIPKSLFRLFFGVMSDRMGSPTASIPFAVNPKAILGITKSSEYFVEKTGRLDA